MGGEILLQVVITGDNMLLAALFVEPHEPSRALRIVVVQFQGEDGVNPCRRAEQQADDGAIAKPIKVEVSMDSRSRRGSSPVRIGVFPPLMEYLGPRTAAAGLTLRMPPVTK